MTDIAQLQRDQLDNYTKSHGDVLTLMHLNIPHLPAALAMRVHQLERKALTVEQQYQVNLSLVDETLGRIVRDIDASPLGQKTLLIVSGDHGFRIMKRTPDDARPVPWVALITGSRAELVIDQPISTVHTARLIATFLEGRVNTPADIANFWAAAPQVARVTRLPSDRD